MRFRTELAVDAYQAAISTYSINSSPFGALHPSFCFTPTATLPSCASLALRCLYAMPDLADTTSLLQAPLRTRPCTLSEYCSLSFVTIRCSWLPSCRGEKFNYHQCVAATYIHAEMYAAALAVAVLIKCGPMNSQLRLSLLVVILDYSPACA